MEQYTFSLSLKFVSRVCWYIQQQQQSCLSTQSLQVKQDKDRKICDDTMGVERKEALALMGEGSQEWLNREKNTELSLQGLLGVYQPERGLEVFVEETQGVIYDTGFWES